MGTRKRRLKQHSNDIPGFTAVFAGAYPLLAVPVGTSWLVANGIIGITWAWIIGTVAVLGLVFLVLPAIQRLLKGPVNSEGCFIGLLAYGLAVLMLPVLWWQGGFDMLFFGTLVVPVLVVVIAVIASTLSIPRKGSRRK